MKIKAIIFDLDGVICHTDKYHYEAWKTIADDLGIFFDEKINNRLRGVSRMESLEIILENYDAKLSEAEKLLLADKKNKIYKKLLEKMTRSDLSQEIHNTLLMLKADGLKLAIGSSSKNAVYILKQIGLDGFFDTISDGNNIRNSKPDPEVFLKAAQYLNCLPQECVVIEDAYAGIDAALGGGFECIGIGDASTYEKATYRINNFQEILECIESIE